MPSRNLAFWLMTGAVCLGAAEITSRIDDRVRYGVGFLDAPDHDRALTIHDDLGVRGRPNGQFKTWKLNGFGFRSPSMSLAPPAGCQRVMVLGASETFGLYETPGEEYPAQLGTLLRERGCYEVVNAAVTGLPIRGILPLWRNWCVRFSPVFVVIYPTPAFYLANRPPAFPGPPPNAARAAPWWTPRLLDRAKDVFEFPAFIQRRRISQAIDSARQGQPPDWRFTDVPPDRLEQFSADLDQLVTDILESGAKPVLLTHATGFQNPPITGDSDNLNAWLQRAPRASPAIMLEFERQAADATRRLALERGAILVDAAQAMDAKRALFASDSLHFNDTGAGVIARLIADRITSAREP